MTNNLDQFDQSPDFEDISEQSGSKAGLKNNLVQAWKTKPIFKLIVLLLALGAVVLAVMKFSEPTPETQISRVASAPHLDEAPGGKSSPEFINATQEANKQRIEAAVAGQGTALPTPLPSGIGAEERKESDPLVEFRAEMKRQKEEQQRQIQALQVQNQQQQQIVVQQDQQLQEKISASLSAQMGQLATLWQPKSFTVVAGAQGAYENMRASVNETQAGGGGHSAPVGTSGATSSSTRKSGKVKPLIMAGTVNYAQMLTEANSDVPGPILAQILSGPLSGARVGGRFSVSNDYLVLRFNLATLKGKEYEIDALALDPETTLGGMATEVDHRYFARVLLPAAASFVSAFGAAISERPSTTVVTNGGSVITTQAEVGIEDGLYAGLGSAGQSISNFLAAEAGRTQVLVRLAVGTPLGLLFLKSVCSGDFPCESPSVPAEQSAPVQVSTTTPGVVAGQVATAGSR